MQPMSLMISLFVFGLHMLPSLISGLQVVLGHTAMISCNRSCSTVAWMRNRIPVVRFVEGKFTVAPEFESRIKFSSDNLKKGNISLVITDTVYNDRSWYTCSCDGHEGCDQYLDVLLPVSLEVAVGDQAKLPCYSDTNKLTPESNGSIRWEKNDALVVKLKHGEMEFGAGFEDRASVSKAKYSNGDLSLTINSVKIPDAGLYRCFHLSEKDTYPEVINLIIKDCSSSNVIIVLAVIIGILVLPLLHVCHGKLLPACLRLKAPPEHIAVPVADVK
ncbi:hypothetical protein C0J50_20299 [Silurus asotus]|uniref:Ig-like domain-containing protein n=1 Tax=Silurus asotus TaxID=30991 RepID=A0AAD5AP42_SILAS|nr:hypothetical protein C0J50_20299 [Silurus asotus]